MTEEVNVGMGAPAPKKGMSKGCLIALIIGVVIVIFIGGIVWYTLQNKDEVMKFGVATLLTSSKQIVVESNVAGIDTAYYNAVVDNFNKRLYADSLDITSMAGVFENVRVSVEDQKMDSTEIMNLMNALIAKYPDIAPEIPGTEILDSMQLE